MRKPIELLKFRARCFYRIPLFLLVLGLLVKTADYCLYNDSTYTRIMFHEMYNSKRIDLAFIGSSVVYRHFDPEIWDDCLAMHTFNLGTSSQTPDDAYYIMKELFKSQTPEYCIYGINYISFLRLETYENPTKSYIIFDYLKPSANKLLYGTTAFHNSSLLNAWIPATRNANRNLIKTVKDVMNIKLTDSYQAYGYQIYESSAEEYKGRGFVYSYDQKEDGAVGRAEGYLFNDYEVSEKYISYLGKLKDLCDANGCQLIFIVPPLPYASMAWQEDYQKILDLYADVAGSLDVALFNFDLIRTEYLHMEDSDFYDSGHMSGKGAMGFSRCASEIVKKYIKGEEFSIDTYFYSSYEELLDSSPWIFNTWIEETEDGYTARSQYGNGIKPEYCFYWSEDKGETWHLLKEYSKESQIRKENIPEGCNMIMTWARPEGTSLMGTKYQQCDKVTVK